MASETITILQMLQDGKISVEEASALMDATEQVRTADPEPAPRFPHRHKQRHNAVYAALISPARS